MNEAKITVTVGDEKFGLEMKSIDFDQSRDDMALSLGRTIVDAIYASTEGVR